MAAGQDNHCIIATYFPTKRTVRVCIGMGGQGAYLCCGMTFVLVVCVCGGGSGRLLKLLDKKPKRAACAPKALFLSLPSSRRRARESLGLAQQHGS